MADTNIYLIRGNDEYRVAAAAKTVVDSLTAADETGFGLEIIDGAVQSSERATSALRRTIEAVQMASFMGTEKTIWLRDVWFLAPGLEKEDESADKAFKSALEDFRETLASGIPSGHTLVISGSRISGTYAVVQDIGRLARSGRAKIQLFEVPTGYRSSEETARWLVEEYAKVGGDISERVARAIVDRAGSDSRCLRMELEKLRAYAGEKTPTEEDVRVIVTPSREAIIWDLQDAFGEGRLSETLNILQRLLNEGVSPIAMVIQLLGRVNELLILRDTLDRRQAVAYPSFSWSKDLSPEQREAAAGLDKRWDPGKKHSFVLKKLLAQCKKLRRIELRKARHLLLEAHEKMVSSPVPPDTLLQTAIISALSR